MSEMKTELDLLAMELLKSARVERGAANPTMRAGDRVDIFKAVSLYFLNTQKDKNLKKQPENLPTFDGIIKGMNGTKLVEKRQ